MGEPSRLATARRAARAGADVAMATFRTDLDVETKDGPTDVVTEADREAQRRVEAVVRESYPDDEIVGEELDARESVPSSGAAWVVDPIDGTNNYTRGMKRWATSVAAVVDGDPVAAVNVFPALEDTYVASPDGVTRNGEPVSVSERSDPKLLTVAPTFWWGFDSREEYAAATRAIVTRFGDLVRVRCAQATLALVAAGSLDGTITNRRLNPWDSVAGAYMVERAGGTVTGLDGEPWTPASEGLVASNGECHDAVLDAARDIEAER